MWKTWTVAIGLILVFVLNARSNASLGVGDAAPEITVSKWLKGDPVAKIESGKVYVFEFWATWCGPCVEMIPHLAALQKKYPDVVFISTDIWEEDDSAVEPFFKEMGDKMQYRVAVDDKSKIAKGAMATNWMTAAGRSTIPTSIVVNKEGKIAWIGHPARLEPILEKILADKYDLTTAKAEYIKQQAIDAEMSSIQEEFVTKIYPLIQSKDYPGIDKAFTEMASGHPNIKSTILGLQFKVLLQGKQYDQAYGASDKILDSAKEEDANHLGQIATIITMMPGIEKRDLDRALKYATKSSEFLKNEDAATLNIIAKIHSDKGDSAKAIEYQEKAVAKAEGEEKKLYEDVLSKYKSPAK